MKINCAHSDEDALLAKHAVRATCVPARVRGRRPCRVVAGLWASRCHRTHPRRSTSPTSPHSRCCVSLANSAYIACKLITCAEHAPKVGPRRWEVRAAGARIFLYIHNHSPCRPAPQPHSARAFFILLIFFSYARSCCAICFHQYSHVLAVCCVVCLVYLFFYINSLAPVSLVCAREI